MTAIDQKFGGVCIINPWQ